jgi:predicted metal-dependent phosphoesterase TrpH
MTTPRRNQVDLHTHTARSDGVLEPTALYAAMRAWGSTLVAITDHDTLAGARELLSQGAGMAPGPALIVGVEINTHLEGELRSLAGHPDDVGELHVLGLGVDPGDTLLEARLAAQREGRRERLERTLWQLEALGMPVRDRLPRPPGGVDALGRPHVARALVGAGHAASVQDAFDRFLVPGAPGYVPRVGMGTAEAVAAILAAGGIASLAHASWVSQAPAVLERLVDWGLRALEVHYAAWDEATIARMADLAADRGLLATGGSDYHGDLGDYAAAQATLHVPPAVGERLLAALAGRDDARRGVVADPAGASGSMS